MAEELKPPPGTDRKVKESLEQIRELERYATKLRSAGFNLGDRQKRVNELKNQFAGIRDTFFPGQG